MGGYGRIYDYNENYFSKIDNLNKAYWVGFITADGYIMNQNLKNNNSQAVGLRIRLAESEKQILENFKFDIGGNFPIRTEKNYGKYENQQDLVSIHISSLQIFNDLTNLGLSSGDKSCKEKFIEFEDANLTKNFILGLFDGDGWICESKSWLKRDNKYRDCYEWGIVSSKEMCEQIKEFLEKEIDGMSLSITKNSKKSTNELYRIRSSSKKNIKLLYEYFYDDNCSTSYSDRKYTEFNRIYNKIK